MLLLDGRRYLRRKFFVHGQVPVFRSIPTTILSARGGIRSPLPSFGGPPALGRGHETYVSLPNVERGRYRTRIGISHIRQNR